MNLSLSPDAVQEFQVQTGSYSAELGGAGGGQVNIITRQGGSGVPTEPVRIPAEQCARPRTWNEMPGTSHLVQNNYGGSIGGPLFGKRTFFFANYEGFRQTEAQTAMDTVPTGAEVAGDFSASGANIFDPSTSYANPNYNPALP